MDCRAQSSKWTTRLTTTKPPKHTTGMAYFGLDPTAPSFPGGLVVGGPGDEADPRAKTRLKEIVQVR